MNRRKFITSIGVVGASALAGCVKTTEEYGLNDEIPVNEGTISLAGIRTTQFLFTKPVDSPTNILGRRDTQFIVFKFNTADLNVESTREFDYITDHIQFQISRDTVEPPVENTPKIESEKENITGVAFEVAEPYTIDKNKTLRWLGDSEANWSSNRIFSESKAVYLKNPPQLTVENVDIPETASGDTGSITVSVSNSGNSTGEFKAIVQGDDTVLIQESIEKGVTSDISESIAISQDEQPVVITWGYDQKSVTINRE